MGSGIRVVGATPVEEHAAAPTAGDPAALRGRSDLVGEIDTGSAATPVGPRRGRRDGPPTGRRRGPAFVVACVVAVLGIAGTIVFGVAWWRLQSQQSGEAQASSRARSFLVDLTNFNAKTVDADFAAITSMATGSFASQADKFFNSSIRQELQRALASSRGQVRAFYVQSYGGGQATVYALVTQLYTNNKITSPQTDVLRMVVDLRQVAGTWKVADVTVLQGPSSAGSAATTPSAGSGSAATAAAGAAGSTATTPSAGSGSAAAGG